MGEYYGFRTTVGGEQEHLRAKGQPLSGQVKRGALVGGAPLGEGALAAGSADTAVLLTSWQGERACLVTEADRFSSTYSMDEVKTVLGGMRVLALAREALAPTEVLYTEDGSAPRVEIVDVTPADETHGKWRWNEVRERRERSTYYGYLVEACVKAPAIGTSSKILGLWFVSPAIEGLDWLFGVAEPYRKQLVTWQLVDGAASPEPTTPAPQLALDRTTFTVGEEIAVRYNQPLVAPAGQQYWLTLVAADAPGTEHGTWHSVLPSASSDKLVADRAGSQEVRLHDLYPRHSARVLHWVRVVVR